MQDNIVSCHSETGLIKLCGGFVKFLTQKSASQEISSKGLAISKYYTHTPYAEND
jgi:hypothetical protein